MKDEGGRRKADEMRNTKLTKEAKGAKDLRRGEALAVEQDARRVGEEGGGRLVGWDLSADGQRISG